MDADNTKKSVCICLIRFIRVAILTYRFSDAFSVATPITSVTSKITSVAPFSG